jgi:hypothetical protein
MLNQSVFPLNFYNKSMTYPAIYQTPIKERQYHRMTSRNYVM